MHNKVIYDAQTGTVLELRDAMVVDVEDLAVEMGKGVDSNDAGEMLSSEDQDAQDAAEKVDIRVSALLTDGLTATMF